MDNVAYATALNGSRFAVTTDGTLWAWGRNIPPAHWQPGPLLGDGTTTDRDTPVRIMGDVARVAVTGNSAYAITNDGGLWEWGAGTGHSGEDDGGAGLRLSPVRILENVVSLAPTYFLFDNGWVMGERAFALTSGGELWGWGENDISGFGWGLLGDGTSERRLSPVRIVFFE